jgi:PAS domain S-box-containing protein
LEKIFTEFFEKSISPSAVALGPDYRLLLVNDAWVRLFGFSRGEAIGRTAYELGIVRDAGLRARIFGELEPSGTVTEMALLLHDVAGRELHVLNNITRLRLDGREYILSSIHDITAHKLAADQRHQHDACLLEELTQRERDVLKLAIAGHSNKDIAARLGISYRTVEVHRSHCIRKLGTRSLLRIKQIADSGHL